MNVPEFPLVPLLVAIAPVILLGRMVWVYAVKRWLESIVTRDEMERRLAEERSTMFRTLNKHRRDTVDLMRSLQLKKRQGET